MGFYSLLLMGAFGSWCFGCGFGCLIAGFRVVVDYWWVFVVSFAC